MKKKQEPYTKEPTVKELEEMSWNLQHLMNYLLEKNLEIRGISFQIDFWQVLVGRDKDGTCKWILTASPRGVSITPLHRQWTTEFSLQRMHKTLDFYLVYKN